VSVAAAKAATTAFVVAPLGAIQKTRNTPLHGLHLSTAITNPTLIYTFYTIYTAIPPSSPHPTPLHG